VAGASRTRDTARVALVTLGCRVNRSDLDALASALPEPFVLAGRGESAEYVVVNTCTVTADADAAARQAIRRAGRDHPGARIVAMGCYAQVRPEELRSLPGVAAVVGARSDVPVGEVLRALHHGSPSPGAGAVEARSPAAAAPVPFRHTRAFLKVQDGCDARCAYCAVPAARGPARSLPLAEALAKVAALGRASPEVVLAGVHLGSYGRDLSPRASLAELVAAAAERRLARRIRLSSVEPLEFPAELLRGAARPALCEHAHLPLQSGSARLLAAMGRPYSPSDYAAVVGDLAAAVPGICIGADVMAGFPGETAGDHRDTLELVERLPLAYLHVFPFSPRPGTRAALMSGQVPAAVARGRARELHALSARRWAAYAAGQRGRELEVAVERVRDGVARGTARNRVTVRWPASGERRGDLVRVLVEGSDAGACAGARARGSGEP
jgi:threonylcarbamoyladenosine tRNA methylthiotransferase MtaB